MGRPVQDHEGWEGRECKSNLGLNPHTFTVLNSVTHRGVAHNPTGTFTSGCCQVNVFGL